MGSYRNGGSGKNYACAENSKDEPSCRGKPGEVNILQHPCSETAWDVGTANGRGRPEPEMVKDKRER